MASPPFIPLLLSAFILASSLSSAVTTAKPAPLVFPVKKDASINRYYTTLRLGTPPAAMNAVLDLGGRFTWLDCSGYVSSSFRSIPCHSSRCSVIGGDCIDCYAPTGPTCANDTCSFILVKPFSDVMAGKRLGEDVLVLRSSNGIKYSSRGKSQQFPFSCVEPFWRGGLSNSTKGMVALARNPSSLATKLSTQLKLPRIFALCLPSSSSSSSSGSGHGNLYVGGSPYMQPPIKQDLVKSLLRTQLLVDPGDTVPISNDGDGYSINVTAIKVDFGPINLKRGIGGVIIRTLSPYTVFQSAIFKPLVKEFTKKAKDRKIKKVAPVSPFAACFDAKTVKSGVAGPDVPAIVLVLQGDVEWRIEGANSMVRVSKDVMCLGFLDSGWNYGTAIVIGGHQMEDNLLEFDVGSSTFGFSNSLLLQNSSCSHF